MKAKPPACIKARFEASESCADAERIATMTNAPFSIQATRPSKVQETPTALTRIGDLEPFPAVKASFPSTHHDGGLTRSVIRCGSSE